jgi:hypothetical protein
MRAEQELNRRHAQLEVKCGGMREKLSAATGELEAKDRKLAAAQRMVHHLGQERNQLQVGSSCAASAVLAACCMCTD